MGSDPNRDRILVLNPLASFHGWLRDYATIAGSKASRTLAK